MRNDTVGIGLDYIKTTSPAAVIRSTQAAMRDPMNSDLAPEILLAAFDQLIETSPPEQLRDNMRILVKSLANSRTRARRRQVTRRS